MIQLASRLIETTRISPAAARRNGHLGNHRHVPPGGPHWLGLWRWHLLCARSLTSLAFRLQLVSGILLVSRLRDTTRICHSGLVCRFQQLLGRLWGRAATLRSVRLLALRLLGLLLQHKRRKRWQHGAATWLLVLQRGLKRRKLLQLGAATWQLILLLRLHTTWLLVLLRGLKRRKLLQLGAATWQPVEFQAVCKQCFPRGVQCDATRGETSSSGSSKTSDEDSAS